MARAERFRDPRSPCAQVASALQSYLDGESDPSTSAMVAEHLEECRRCGLEAGTYKAIKAALAGAGDGEIDDATLDRLRRFAQGLAEPPH